MDFFANLQAFAERFPTLGERLSTIRPGIIQAAKTQDDGYCYVKQVGNKWETLSEANTPIVRAQEAVESMRDRLEGGLAPLVVIGLNPGYVLDFIYRYVKENAYDNHIPRRIYVIINSIDCLYGWLKQADRLEIIAQPAIEFYWHEDVSQIVELCKTDETRSHLFLPMSSLPEQQAMKLIEPLAEVFLFRQQQEEDYKVQNDAYYDAIDDEELGKVLAGEAGRKPRLLVPAHGSSTVVQYSVRDTAAMFEDAGWEVRIIYMKTDLSRWRIQKNIAEFKPDVYLLVNHLRTHDAKYYPDNMMFITWMQDTVSKVNNTKAAAKWNEHVDAKKYRRDLIIGYVAQIKEYGYREDRLEECPMIVNQDIFRPRELTSEELEKYSCDVCFASNRSTPTDIVARELAEKLGKYGFSEDVMMQIHDHLWEWYRDEQTCTSYVDLENKVCELEAVRELFAGVSEKDDHDFVNQRLFWELNDIIYRHVVLEWLDEMGDVKLFLYGRGWEDHPKFGKYAKGVLEHGEELNKAYQGAGWCLHLNSMEGEHQRISEISKSGNKILSRSETKNSRSYRLLFEILIKLEKEPSTFLTVREQSLLCSGLYRHMVFKDMLTNSTRPFNLIDLIIKLPDNKTGSYEKWVLWFKQQLGLKTSSQLQFFTNRENLYKSIITHRKLSSFIHQSLFKDPKENSFLGKAVIAAHKSMSEVREHKDISTTSPVIFKLQQIQRLFDKGDFSRAKVLCQSLVKKEFENTIDINAFSDFFNRNLGIFTKYFSTSSMVNIITKCLEFENDETVFALLAAEYLKKGNLALGLQLTKRNLEKRQDALLDYYPYLLLLIEAGDYQQSLGLLANSQNNNIHLSKGVMIQGYISVLAALGQEDKAFEILNNNRQHHQYKDTYIAACCYSANSTYFSYPDLQEKIDTHTSANKALWRLRFADLMLNLGDKNKHKEIVTALCKSDFRCFLHILEYIKHLSYCGKVQKALDIVAQEYLKDHEYVNGYSTIAWYSKLDNETSLKLLAKDYSQHRQTYIWKVRYATKLLENGHYKLSAEIYDNVKEEDTCVDAWQQEFNQLKRHITQYA